MARHAVVGNGQMLVGIDGHGLVKDFYFPYVGQRNLSDSRLMPHQIGVWVNGVFSWVDDSWQVKVWQDHQAMVARAEFSNSKLGVFIASETSLVTDKTIFFRRFEITNTSDNDQEIRLFLHQVFHVSSSGRGDSAFFVPRDNYILDYKGETALIIYGRSKSGAFSQFAVGNYGIEGKQGTFRDAEDGLLSGNLVEHGGVDSVIGFDLGLSASETQTVEYWITAGHNEQDALNLHRQMVETTLADKLQQVRQSDADWLETANRNMVGVPEAVREKINQSLLVIRSHIDNGGSILASGDSSIYNYGRDYYAYCWPRDGAYAVWPLLRLGYRDEVESFLDFCADVIHDNGYLQHKFQPDGSFGSTWHPLVQENHPELAIQEDETAIVLFMLIEYSEKNNLSSYLLGKLNKLVLPAANFLAGFIDAQTGLAHASYDLWEQKFLSTTYTNFLVAASLQRAAAAVEAVAPDEDTSSWRQAAARILDNIGKLFDGDQQSFIKGLRLHEDGKISYDKLVDASSLYAAAMFGRDSQGFALAQTAAAVESQLFNAGGIIRYQGDNYMLTDDSSPGNPWIVCTMWLAQYYIMTSQPDKAGPLLEWAERSKLSSGLFSEQVDPSSGQPVGVTPLIWSHAEYINTLLDLHTQR